MILCFDIGGSRIRWAEAHGPQDLRHGGEAATPAEDLRAFQARLRRAVSTASAPPKGLALSIAGVVDPVSGVATIANIPCLDGLPLRAELEAVTGLPVLVANDADCFALAEARLGAGRGARVTLGLILGSGIGGGLVIDGSLVNPAGGFAGEIGHGPVLPESLDGVALPRIRCGCGQIGCLETLCSARGMERLHAHLHPGARLDSRAITAVWEAGEAAAGRTITAWLSLLSGPLAMVQNLIGADVIAVGGGLSGSVALMDALDGALRARILKPDAGRLIHRAEAGAEPGLTGAALLGLTAFS